MGSQIPPIGSQFLPKPKVSFDPSKPATELPKPTPQQGIVPTPTEISIPENYQNAERKGVLSSLKALVLNTGTFIKEHPFLAIIMVIGVILLITAFPALAIALTKVLPSITLFHAKIALGVGFGVMILYYGIYLIDMARTTSPKELIGKIRDKEKILKEQLQTELKHSVDTLRDKMRSKSEELKEESSQELVKIDAQIEACSLQMKKIETEKTDLAVELVAKESELTDKLPDSLKALLPSFKKRLESQAGTLTRETASLPQIAPPNEIIIPDIKPNEENKGKLVSIKEAIAGLGSWLVSNPASVVVMLIGIVVTLVAVPALVLYLKGASSLAVIGPLSIYVVLQFAIYGISLVYQGYAHAEIKLLNDKMANLDNEYAQKLVEMEGTFARQAKDMQGIFESFLRYKNELDSVVKAKQNQFTEHLKQTTNESIDLADLQKAYRLFLEGLTLTIAGIPIHEAKINAILNAPVKGAELL